MALTIRLELSLLQELAKLASARRIGIREIVVDLLREHCGLPAIPRKPHAPQTIRAVNTWLQIKG